MDHNTMYLNSRDLAPIAITGARFVPQIAVPRPLTVPAGVASLLSVSLASGTPLSEQCRMAPLLPARVEGPATLRAALRATLDRYCTAFYMEIPGAGRWWKLEGQALLLRDDNIGRLILEIDLALLANYLPRRTEKATVHAALDIRPVDLLIIQALAPLSAAHLVPVTLGD